MEAEAAIQTAKKLLIKTAQRWWFVNPPINFSESFIAFGSEIKTSITADEMLNGILLFVENWEVLTKVLPQVIPVLKAETVCWIAYPKKSSGIVSDLEMTGNWSELEKYNLRIVSAASINQTWTALRLRPIEQVKKSTISNAAIKQNELNAFSDTKNKLVHLPEDVKQALKKAPAAFAVYQKLAYSHRKEYLVWILTAKQEKTRTGRIQKLIEKLLEKK